ncbi:MAG: hypothetical protein OQK82_03560, partial [Candidatus Pacearchaeota archaeon]|nr:hypothetical protein [Candidatus Pacearchaeota archaeon]
PLFISSKRIQSLKRFPNPNTTRYPTSGNLSFQIASSSTSEDYLLIVSKSGSGTVTSSPSGINCGSYCAQSYSSATSVTLTANPSTGYTFSSWSGACSGSGTCTVSMTSSKNVTANFSRITYNLIVSKSGNGIGTVTSSPNGINCGSYCSKSYNSGTSVTLTADPSSIYSFYGWGGDCSGTGNCTVSMTSSKNVTAYFGYACETAILESQSGRTLYANRVACGMAKGYSRYTIKNIFYNVKLVTVFQNNQVVIKNTYSTTPYDVTLVDWYYGPYDSSFGGNVSVLEVKCGTILSPCTTNITIEVDTGGYGEIFDLYIEE